ncbi:unnamed protein product [Closterium sp. NIES-65]|nr:unnamed protein product [Closterium sp. NIES-65]
MPYPKYCRCWLDNMKRVVAVYKKVLAHARQISAGAKIRGFASNVANYNPLFAYRCPASEKCPLVKNPSTGEINYDSNPCIDENRFTSLMNAYLGALGLPTRKKLGNSPVDRECDPLDQLGVEALADAPRAGQWFQAEFAMLVRNAGPPFPAATMDLSGK